MFDLHLTLGEKVIRALVIYLFLVIASGWWASAS